jgi:hypothetical protein
MPVPRLRLLPVAFAVGALPRGDGRQDETGAEAPRQDDERPRPPAGTRRQIGHACVAQFGAPDLGVALLGLRHALVDGSQLRAGFELG